MSITYAYKRKGREKLIPLLELQNVTSSSQGQYHTLPTCLPAKPPQIFYGTYSRVCVKSLKLIQVLLKIREIYLCFCFIHLWHQ